MGDRLLRTTENVHLAEPRINRSSAFVVGVSGHRELDPAGIAGVRDAVAAFVLELKRFLLHTELQLVIGMAEGADLLVAQTALELGVHIEAVLPMPLEHYAGDFGSEQLALLHALLKHPDVHISELPLDPARGVEPTAAAHTERDSMYAGLTATLIRRSSLLLAIWDGQVSPLPGGTADTVLRYVGARTEENSTEDTLAFVDSTLEMDSADHLVYWIPAGRSDSRPLDATRKPCFVLGVGDNVLQVQQSLPSLLKMQLKELDDYNRDFDQMTREGALRHPDSLAGALPASLTPRARALLQTIDAQYGKADALAVYYQLRSNRLFGLFGVMTFTMGLAYLIYEKLTESRLVLLAYLAILLSSLGLYHLLQGRRWFAKHLTYRALAETMRAKFYLTLAGVGQRVDAAEVLALSGINRFRGFSWLGYILKTVEPTIVDTTPGGESGSNLWRSVEAAWIETQHRYFTANVASLENSSRRFKILRNTLFVVILLVIITLFVFGEHLHHVDTRLGVPVKNLLTFCMGFLAVLLGVWELHQDKMATHELLWQYRNQLSHFSRARLQLSRTSSVSHRNDVLVELGRDSLMESYLWTIHRYHREHEPPAAH